MDRDVWTTTPAGTLATMSEAPVLPTATYAVTGATGHLGRLAVDALLRHGVPARNVFALVRDTAKADELAALGVGVREADYDRPETLDAALEGIERLLLVSSPTTGERLTQHGNVIRRRGRRRRRLRRLHERAPRRRDRARAGARARRHRGPPPGAPVCRSRWPATAGTSRTTPAASTSTSSAARSSAPRATDASRPRRAPTTPRPRSRCSPATSPTSRATGSSAGRRSP